MTEEFRAFRREVLASHPAAFALLRETLEVFETAIVQPRPHPTIAAMVLDMLHVQAHKSIGAVAVLCQHGLMEDAATLTRRLLEIGVQSVFIGAEEDEKLRDRKAGMYLAFMWRGLPRRVRQRLSPAARQRWSVIARRYGRFIPRKAKTWGPNWRDMFVALGAEDTYVSDYSFLSAIAHGRPDNQLFAYAANHVEIHSHEFVSTLLGYAVRYYLMAAEQWNRYFNVVDAELLSSVTRKALAFNPVRGTAAMSTWDAQSSFVTPLLRQLIGAVDRIAPSKSERLQELMDRVTVVVTDEPGLAFAVTGDEDPRQLCVPVLGLEFLWAISFAHVTIYQHAKREGEQTMEFASHPSIAVAAKTLTFAMHDRLDNPPSQSWPSYLPTPSFYPIGETRAPSDVELATEVFACAVAWILHHELGHLALDHLDKWSQDPGDEAAADRAATDWLLDGITEPVVVVKCGLGMATAAVALFSFTCASGEASDLTLYPPAGERLLAALSGPAFGDNHQAQDYACLSLKVHLDHHQIPVASITFDRTIDCLRSYAKIAAAHERKLFDHDG